MANKINPKTKLLHVVLGFLCLFLVHSANAQDIDSNDSLTDSIGFVSDDLTFKLEPSMEPMLANNNAIGLSLKIKF